ncbi:hypothetical protein S245_056474, partial [Arachis hypogaea]
ILFRWRETMKNIINKHCREERLSACEDLGANVVVNYKTEDSVARLKKETRAK